MAPMTTELSQFNCEFCEFSTSSKSQVSNHLLMSHYCSISYSCTLCDFFCDLREIFTLHLQSQHVSSKISLNEYHRDIHNCDQSSRTPLHQNIQWPVESIKTDGDKFEVPMKKATSGNRHKKTRSLSSENSLRLYPQKQSIFYKDKNKNVYVEYDGKKVVDPIITCAECNMKFKSVLSLKSHLKLHLIESPLKTDVVRKIGSAASVASPNLGKVRKIKEMQRRTLSDSSSIKGVKISLTSAKTKGKYRHDRRKRVVPFSNLNTEDQSCEERDMQIHVCKKEALHTKNDIDGRDMKEMTKDSHYTDSEVMFSEVAKGIDRKATEFPCPHCAYVGKVFRNFKEHVMGHSDQRPYVCSSCCRSFVCKSKLVRHQRQVHNEERPFLCSECTYTAKSRSCLETHRLVMHPLEEHLQFSCPHCPARFARASMLKTHALRHNTGPHKLFSCPQCSFTTNYRRQFELHTTLHTGKHCLCSLCGRAYTGQAQLKVHMKVHHSDQSFQCTLCDFVTKRPEGLTKHMKSHSTERPYACPHCDYRGKRKAHLTRHLSRHSNNDRTAGNPSEPARFQCASCQKAFKSEDKLAQHLNTGTCSTTSSESPLNIISSGKITNNNSASCTSNIVVGSSIGTGHVSFTSVINSKESNSITSTHSGRPELPYKNNSSNSCNSSSTTPNREAAPLYTPSTASSFSTSTTYSNQHLGHTQPSHHPNQYQGPISVIRTQLINPVTSLPNTNPLTLTPSLVHHCTMMANSTTQLVGNQHPIITSSGCNPVQRSEYPYTVANTCSFTHSISSESHSATPTVPAVKQPNTPSLIHEQTSMTAPLIPRQLITEGLNLVPPVGLLRPPTGHLHSYTTSVSPYFSHSTITPEQSKQHQSILASTATTSATPPSNSHLHSVSVTTHSGLAVPISTAQTPVDQFLPLVSNPTMPGYLDVNQQVEQPP